MFGIVARAEISAALCEYQIPSVPRQPSGTLRPGPSEPETFLFFYPHETGMVTELADLHGTRLNGPLLEPGHLGNQS